MFYDNNKEGERCVSHIIVLPETEPPRTRAVHGKRNGLLLCGVGLHTFEMRADGSTAHERREGEY